MIANRYEQKLEDVQSWLSLTKWSQKNLDLKEVDVIQGKLLQLDLISEKKPSEEILYFF